MWDMGTLVVAGSPFSDRRHPSDLGLYRKMTTRFCSFYPVCGDLYGDFFVPESPCGESPGPRVPTLRSVMNGGGSRGPRR